jgi:hypothetical protein
MCKVLSEFINVATNTANVMIQTTAIGRRVAAADVDAIRFLASSGNIASGTFRLYALENSWMSRKLEKRSQKAEDEQDYPCRDCKYKPWPTE